MKHEKVLMLLLLIVSVLGTTGSILYTNRRVQSVLSQFEQLNSTESISVQDIAGTDFDLIDPFAQFDDLFTLQEDLHNRIQTQRIIPGQGSVSVIQQSVVIDGKKVSYTLLVEPSSLSGTIVTDDDVLKAQLIKKFKEKSIEINEISDGTIEFLTEPSLLDFVQDVLGGKYIDTDVLES